VERGQGEYVISSLSGKKSKILRRSRRHKEKKAETPVLRRETINTKEAKK